MAAVAFSIPPARSLIEQSMFWHMIVQMPLLVIAGYGLAASMPNRFDWFNRFNYFGLTSFMAILVIVTYWMLPVTIDRAVALNSVDAAKIGSLLLCGACLKFSFHAAPRIVQLFFIGYLLAMLITLGVYFVTSDARLCNAYSQDSQIRTGYGLMVIALACIVVALKSASSKKSTNRA
jgi:hypothetical protein